jgi:hypothetical protein
VATGDCLRHERGANSSYANLASANALSRKSRDLIRTFPFSIIENENTHAPAGSGSERNSRGIRHRMTITAVAHLLADEPGRQRTRINYILRNASRKKTQSRKVTPMPPAVLCLLAAAQLSPTQQPDGEEWRRGTNSSSPEQ